MSRAIDRATRWESILEFNGYTVTREYSEGNSGRQVTYTTEIGFATLRWIIYLDTPRTKFCVGQTSRFSISKITNAPSQMSQWIFSEMELDNYKAAQTA
tara:strand:+ start:1912 stop:2208 length:297 start_codon:yes stop_codon:yes gene_type:complete